MNTPFPLSPLKQFKESFLKKKHFMIHKINNNVFVVALMYNAFYSSGVFNDLIINDLKSFSNDETIYFQFK